MHILIADDHDLLRDSLGKLLIAEAGAEIWYAGDLAGALDLMTNRRFDLVLLDYSMPGMDGFAGLAQAVHLAEGRPVALMSGTAPSEAGIACLDLGGAGFIPKTMPARSFINAVRFMAAGEKYLPPETRRPVEGPSTSPIRTLLTDREQHVLQGLCDGLSNKEIARQLDIREPTVKVHAQAVFRKIGARNRTHAAMIARAQGFLDRWPAIA
jgi:two-component system nitrate/nitrite response regulator NarL